MKTRIYDQSSINPKGIPEDPERCIKDVHNWKGWHILQCSRKRGHGVEGLYCKQHGKKYENQANSKDR